MTQLIRTNATNTAPTAPTMSSLEIAKLTGKEHKNVLADIRRILKQVGIDELTFLATYLDAYGREKPCYNLPRLEADLIISGYSVPYRLAIIDRWQELEQSAGQDTSSLMTDPQTARVNSLRMVGALFQCPPEVIEQMVVKESSKTIGTDV